MSNLMKTKIVNNLKHLSSKVKCFLSTELQDYRLTSEYINFICPDVKKNAGNQIEQLRELVEQSIIREFSPDIQNIKSYDSLIDDVMYRVQKKSLEEERSEELSNEPE